MGDKKGEREARLAAALRDNLRKRKAQARQLSKHPDGKGDGERDRDDHS